MTALFNPNIKPTDDYIIKSEPIKDIEGVEKAESVIIPEYNDALFLRWSVYQFMHDIASELKKKKVLEIGPRDESDHASLPMKSMMPPICRYETAIKRE